ncbi:MAG: hypothetical protein ACOCRK_01565 [bacterium]
MQEQLIKEIGKQLLRTIESINYKTLPDRELFKLYHKLPAGLKQLSYQELEELEDLLKADSLNKDDKDRLKHYLDLTGYEGDFDG